MGVLRRIKSDFRLLAEAVDEKLRSESFRCWLLLVFSGMAAEARPRPPTLAVVGCLRWLESSDILVLSMRVVCGILLLAVLMGYRPLLKLAFFCSFRAVFGGEICLSDGCAIRMPIELLCCHLLVKGAVWLKPFALLLHSAGEIGEI